MNTKSLYIWSVLKLVHRINLDEAYYTNEGIVFALAFSVEEARQMVMDKLNKDKELPLHLRNFDKPSLIIEAISEEPIVSNGSAHIFADI